MNRLDRLNMLNMLNRLNMLNAMSTCTALPRVLVRRPDAHRVCLLDDCAAEAVARHRLRPGVGHVPERGSTNRG